MSPKPSLRSQLIGAWELQSYTAYKPSNHSDIVYPLGPNARGIIMYTPSGHMSAQLLRPGQAIFAGGDGVSSATESEWAEAGRNFVAYTGRFFLDESKEEPVLLHEMQVSNIPKLVGDVQRRMVEIKEEDGVKYLYLGVKKESLVMGEMRAIEVKWKRMEDNEGKLPARL